MSERSGSVLVFTALIRSWFGSDSTESPFAHLIAADAKEAKGNAQANASPAPTSGGPIPMTYGAKDLGTPVTFPSTSLTSAAAKPIVRQVLRPEDVGIATMQGLSGISTNSSAFLPSASGQTLSAKASNIQILPPVVNPTGMVSQSVIQSRRNNSMDLRGEPKVKIYDRGSLAPINQSTIGDADIPGKAARTVVQDIVPKPVDFMYVQNFFTNPKPLSPTLSAGGGK